MATIKIIGLAAEHLGPTPVDGHYLVAYDPLTDRMDTTPFRVAATDFGTKDHALEVWRTAYGVRPDGQTQPAFNGLPRRDRMKILGREVDIAEVAIWSAFGVLGLVLAIGLMAGALYEAKHPCIKRGPERLAYMQKVGDTLIPVYERPCVERAAEK